MSWRVEIYLQGSPVDSPRDSGGTWLRILLELRAPSFRVSPSEKHLW
ncbi:hypothetical protein ABHI18_000021, partial [Aspergillus niger]